MAITFEVAPVDVVNEALGICGKDFIVDLESTTDTTAIKCKRYYASMLRSMLRDHPYRFANAPPLELATTGIPTLDARFPYPYALPPDCVRVNQVNGSDKSRWVVVGRQLWTDVSVATIEYTRWQPDPNVWDGAFYQAFVTYLSVRFAAVFNSDMAKASDQYKVYQMQSFDAKAISGQEGSQEVMTCDDLTDQIRE